MDKAHILLNQTKEIEENVKKEIPEAQKTGLTNFRAIVFLILWYIFSGCTLFLNKYILTYLNGNPTVLGNRFQSNFIPILKFLSV